MGDLNSILYQLLSAQEERPEASIEEIIDSLSYSLGLSLQDLDEIKDSLKVLDEINEKALDLRKAKNDGSSRADWISDQISEITLGEEGTSHSLMNDIEEATNDALKNTIRED